METVEEDMETVEEDMETVSEKRAVATIVQLGALAADRLYDMGRMGLFLVRTATCVFVPPLKVVRVLKQIRFIGFDSLLVVALTGAFAGMVLAFQGYHTLEKLGSTAFLGPMVGLSLLRELGPVLTALMVTGRAGSAIAAEIGIMRITEQIDELEVLGLSPYRYLVVPNFLAALIAVPLLTAIFDVVGILGGYLVGVWMLGISAGTYFGEMKSYTDMHDVLGGIYKSISFGALVAWICCYKGYFAGFGAEGVSKATTQAVVMSSVLILVWDYFMTSLLF